MTLTHEGYQHRLGLLLAFGTLIWSGTYNALAKGLTPYLSPVTLLIISEALTAVFIIMTFGLMPLLRELSKMSAKSFRICVFYGLLNSAIAPLFWFTGLKFTSAVNASVLSASDIVFFLVLSHFFLNEKMSKLQGAGLSVIVAGIFVVNIGSGFNIVNIQFGDLLIVVGSFFSGCGTVLFKKHLSHIMPELAIVIRNIAAILAVAVFGSILQLSIKAEVSAFPLEKIFLLLAFTFFSRYLLLTFFYESLDRLPATTFSLIQVATPLSGMVFAVLLLNESISGYQAMGGGLILLGLIIENYSSKSVPKMSFIRSSLAHFHYKKSNLVTQNVVPMVPRNV